MIEQGNNKYLLIIKIIPNKLVLTETSLEEIYNSSYSRNFTLKDIKEIHKIFFLFNSFKEFSDYLMSIADLKKLLIIIKEDILILSFQVDYLLKKENIEIKLTPQKIDLENVVKNLCDEIKSIKDKLKTLENAINGHKVFEDKMKNIENENTNIKKENTLLKNQINEMKQNMESINKKFRELNIRKAIKNSVIIKNMEEFNIIIIAIKSRINKEIKEIKKLYQATIDGGEPNNFHSKCDNIPNTLTVIQTKGNRRFGGFTTLSWDRSGQWKDDKNAFLFSLDKQKIYKYKNDEYSICCYGEHVLAFGHACDIFINNGRVISTGESYFCSYEYNGDKNALAEDGKCNYLSAEEYEVFQIIFE